MTVILERGVKIKWALPFPHSTALREFPGHRTRRVNWARTRWTLWAKEVVLRISGNQDSYRFQCRVPDRRVLHRDSLWVVPLRGILQSTDWSMCVRKLLEVGKEPPEQIGGDWPLLTQGQDVQLTHQPDYRASQSTGHWVAFSGGPCLSSGE